MRADTRQTYRKPARRAGERSRARKHLTKRIAGQIVRTVDLSHSFALKKSQAAFCPLPCFLRALEQQEHVPPHAPSFQQQRHAAECGRMAVVTAQMRCMAFLLRQRVIISTQRDPCRRCARFAVHAIKTGAAVVQLQRGMFRQKAFDRRRRPRFLPAWLSACVQRTAQPNKLCLPCVRKLYHDGSSLMRLLSLPSARCSVMRLRNCVGVISLNL